MPKVKAFIIASFHRYEVSTHLSDLRKSYHSHHGQVILHLLKYLFSCLTQMICVLCLILYQDTFVISAPS